MRGIVNWPAHVRRTIQHVATLFAAVYMLARSRALSSGSPTIRTLTQRDDTAWQLALLQRENDILRRRLEALAPQHRPHYAPGDRFAIMQVMRLRHWSIERAAERFVLHPNTIRSWLKEFLDNGNVGRFFGTPPFNKISNGVRWMVHQIHELCPEPGFGPSKSRWH